MTFTSPATPLFIYLFIFCLSWFAIAVQPFHNLTLPLSKNNDNALGEVSLIVYYFNLYLWFSLSIFYFVLVSLNPSPLQLVPSICEVCYSEPSQLRASTVTLFILSLYVESSPYVESQFFIYTPTDSLFYLYFY